MRLGYDFFNRDVLKVAPELVGKTIVHKLDGEERRLMITETEAYKGTDDTACHAHKGKTERTKILWESAGTIYVYICYGVHFLMNIVTGDEGDPQAVLIRACEGKYNGPGKLTKQLGIDMSANRKRIYNNDAIWIEDTGVKARIRRDKRVGIGYARQRDIDRPWRYIMKIKPEKPVSRQRVKPTQKAKSKSKKT